MFRRRAEDIFKIIDKVCKGFFKFAFVFLSEIYPNNIIFHINIPPMLRIILILIIPHKGNYVKKILIILYRFYVTGTVLTSVLQSVTGTDPVSGCYGDSPVCLFGCVLQGQSYLPILVSVLQVLQGQSLFYLFYTSRGQSYLSGGQTLIKVCE